MKQLREFPGRSRWSALALGLTLGGCIAGSAQAGTLDIADSPLFLVNGVPPNLLFLLDDSGSMGWETLPSRDGVDWLSPSMTPTDTPLVPFHGDIAASFRSPQGNELYYDPSITYRPWVGAEGEEMPEFPPSAAPNHPLRQKQDGVVDLTVDYTEYRRWWSDDYEQVDEEQSYYIPVYYFWDGLGPPDSESSYDRVEVRPGNTYSGHGRESRTDCADSPICTYDEEIRNFANWYTYHRDRMSSARAAIGRAFAEFDDSVRVGYGRINSSKANVDGVNARAVVRGVRPFSGDAREDFFDRLYSPKTPRSGSTPLRPALEGAGEYFSRTDDRGPWSSTPGEAGGDELVCRQNYTVLMTDGYSTGNGKSGPAVQEVLWGDIDNTSAHSTLNENPAGDDYKYVPADPFRSPHEHTLADIALYYWMRDLRPDLINRVPVSTRNEAFWQHMVTYGIGLGVSGSIDPDDALQAVTDGTPVDWPDPVWSNIDCFDENGPGCQARLDDLLHATINGRGGFYNADSPEIFAEHIQSLLADIAALEGETVAASATSAAVLQEGSRLFITGFRSTDWSGQFRSVMINDDGSLGEESWNAEAVLEAAEAARSIYTVNADTGEAVTLSDGLSALSESQSDALNTNIGGDLDELGEQRLDWLQGETVSGLRSRQSGEEMRLLGDIINASPVYVDQRDYGYSLLGGSIGADYTAFRESSTYTDRTPVVYVGANDGMLHAFDADTGEELFAFMPSNLFLPDDASDAAQINALMDPDYSHRYFVDGTPSVSDAYVDGQWRTVLVGTMGRGGRTVFALDVSDPDSFGPDDVLWEFTHPNLGYGVEQPAIVPLANGQWAAVFGNGYNSDAETAGLYIVPLDDPDEFVFIDTGEGGEETPNGLSTVMVTDWPAADLQARRVYAGDLLGNMWRFDIDSPAPGQWSNESNRRVLFQATDPTGLAQPITARPELAADPGDPGSLMIVFGTGSYLTASDDTSTQVQTLYGLRDQDVEIPGRDVLLEQSITWQDVVDVDTGSGSQTLALREISDAVPDESQPGWYIDLIHEDNAQGERVVSAPTFPSGNTRDRVRFSTLIPDDDPCGTGRSGYVMDIDLATGGSSGTPVFDINGDFSVDGGDNVSGKIISGVGGSNGEGITTVQAPEGGLDFLFGGSDLIGVGSNNAGSSGRQSWRQFR